MVQTALPSRPPVGLRLLSRSIAFNLLGGFGSLAVGFATSIMLADWLGPTRRGLLGVLLTASSLGYGVAGAGLSLAVVYYVSREPERGPAIFADTLLYGGLIALVFVPGAWFLQQPLARLFASGQGGRIWVLAGALVPLTFIAWTTYNQLLGRLRFGFYNALVLCSRLATLLLVAVLVGIVGLGVTGAMVATIAAMLVLTVGSLPAILAQGRPRPDRALFRKLLSYGARAELSTLLQSINYRFDVLVLGLFASLAQVGYYFVAEVLAELVVTVAGAFQASVIPLVAHAEGSREQDATTVAAVRHYLILATGATAANAIFSPLVILFALNGGYRPGLVPFFILLPSMVILGSATVVQGDLRGRDRPGLASKYGALAVATTLALDFALIPPFGPVGAAIASVCAYTVYGIASLRGLSHLTGIPLRELAVPTRADLALYRGLPRGLVHRLSSGASTPLEEI